MPAPRTARTAAKAMVSDALEVMAAERKQRAAAESRLKATPEARPKRGAAATSASASPRSASRAKPGPRRASAGTLVAEGDSWFDYPFNDVLKMLELEHAYDIESVARRGDTLESMAYGEGQLAALGSRIEKVLRRGETLRGVLLSGGGNDIAGAEFAMLLNHARSRRTGLNERVVAGVIDERLAEASALLLDTVTGLTRALRPGVALPIVVHGYDYPVADGRGFAGGFWILPGPWLAPGLRQKGYDPIVQGAPVLKALIDRFNAMLATLVAQPKYAHVRFVDLRGTLQGRPHRDWWADELHPSKRGFRTVAQKFAEALLP